jgi:MoaA/NifB/PqqE/SkfB family radical SAM enzyme
MHGLRHLNIEVTRNCNQKCFYCFNNSGPSRNSEGLSVDEWYQTLVGLVPFGLRSVHLTGGEPFVWNGTIELLDRAQFLGLGTSILSNGTRVPEFCKTYPAIFSRLSVAQISLDSMTAKQHDERRGIKGAWEVGMGAILALRVRDVPVEISCTLDEENLHEFVKLAEFCATRHIRLLLRPLASPAGQGRFAATQSLERKIREAFHRLSYSHRNLINRDRFLYGPPTLGADLEAPQAGTATAKPSGAIRAVSHDWPLASSSEV